MDNTSMFVSLTMVVFISALLLAFSQELSRFVKKMADIPGMKLLAPLAFASLLIEIYYGWCNGLLLLLCAGLNRIIQNTAALLPFQMGSLFLIRVVFLFLLVNLPVWIVWLNAQRTKKNSSSLFPYYLSAVLWLIAVFLLIRG